MDFLDYQFHISGHHLDHMIVTLTRARLEYHWFLPTTNVKRIMNFD